VYSAQTVRKSIFTDIRVEYVALQEDLPPDPQYAIGSGYP
jgi:hypothetical protein